MKQNHSHSNRKSFWILLVFGALFALITTCCAAVISAEHPKETRAPQEFPKTDIIYANYGGLGFVNADGSNLTRVRFSAKMAGGRFSGYSGRATRPAITGDNQTVIVQVNPNGYFGMKNLYGYKLALWRTGELPLMCWGWNEQPLPLLSAGQKHILIQTEQGIALYDLNGCGEDNRSVKTFQNVSGVPSPDLRYVAYTDPKYEDERFVIVLDMANGKKRVVGKGDYPAWSRDGQWLAYTGVDGIYVVNVTVVKEPQQAILFLNPGGKVFPTYVKVSDSVPPEVSWSPDGQWLAYHKLIGTETISDPDYYAIYKLNIATGEEFKIVDGGVYPFWRWPAEER